MAEHVCGCGKAHLLHRGVGELAMPFMGWQGLVWKVIEGGDWGKGVYTVPPFTEINEVTVFVP